jgi:hypothetical protein
MPEYSLATSFWLVARTFPFMLLRIAVYFGVASAIFVAAGAGAGLGQAIGSLGGPAGRIPGMFWGSLAGIAFVAAIVWWLREYFLFLIRAGHLAALTLALDGKPLAAGPGQVAQAADLVQRRFRDAGLLLQIERLVDRSIADLLSVLPPPDILGRAGGERITAANKGLSFVLGFLRELVLAAPLRNTARGVWPEIRDALVEFGQNADNLMRHAFLLAAAAYAVSFAVFLLALVVMTSRAGPSFLIEVLLAAVLAWAFKRALIDPVLAASMLQVFFRAAKDRQPDPVWDVKLTEGSEAFREIKARSMQIGRGSGQF